MKRCAYCGASGPFTREHIIPKFLIDLFPEHVIAITDRGVFDDESVVRDVCETCNGGVLSRLDGYGATVVRNNFLQTFDKDSEYTFHYDYNQLSRWLLKLAYNTMRSIKSLYNDLGLDWYVSNVPYIRGVVSEPTRPFSVFGGLCVEMIPTVLREHQEEQPVRISRPYFMMQPDSPTKIPPIEHLLYADIVRFNSGIFLTLLWDETIQQKQLEVNEALVETLFPYRLLKEESNSVILRRVTDMVNSGNFVNLGVHSNAVIGINDLRMMRYES